MIQITVVHLQIFLVKVKSGGSWIDLGTLSSILFSIQCRDADLSHVPLGDRVAILSSSARDRWAQHREALRKKGTVSDVYVALVQCPGQ